MEKHLVRAVLCIAFVSAVICGNPRKARQGISPGTGISIAFPALNFLGGGLGNNNRGNVFGGSTFTRTVVSTGIIQNVYTFDAFIQI